MEKSRGAHLVHDGVEVLLSGTMFVLHTVLPLLLEVSQQLEHLSVTAADVDLTVALAYLRGLRTAEPGSDQWCTGHRAYGDKSLLER